MYTKDKLLDESGNEKDILTFGPVRLTRNNVKKYKNFIEERIYNNLRCYWIA